MVVVEPLKSSLCGSRRRSLEIQLLLIPCKDNISAAVKKVYILLLLGEKEKEKRKEALRCRI